MGDDEKSIPEQIVEELGIDPAASIDDRQRFELLRRWHQSDEEKKRDD